MFMICFRVHHLLRNSGQSHGLSAGRFSMNVKRIGFATVSLCMCLISARPSIAFAESSAVDSALPGAGSLGQARVSGILLTRGEAVRIGDAYVSNFELERAELGIQYSAGWLGARLRFETVRSAGTDSFIGIDQNSILPRIRFAYGEWTPFSGDVFNARLRMGVVPEPWVESLEEIFDVRGLGPLASQQLGLFSPADLGVLGDFKLWQGMVHLQVGVLNGEGHSQIELNTGKNTIAVLSLRSPDINLWGPLRFSAHGGVRDGSVGIASVRDHRGMLAFAMTHPWLDIGSEFTHAWGYQGRAKREAQSIGIWLRGQALSQWLGYAFRYDRFDVDVALGDTERDAFLGAIYTELISSLSSSDTDRDRIRLYLGGEWARAGDRMGLLPGIPDALSYTRIFLMMEAVGGLSVPLLSK